MIKAVIFDLDGTLVQTEILKARSYAEALHLLSGGAIDKESVLKVFKIFVGLSRNEVAIGLVSLFGDSLKDYNKSKDYILEILIQTRIKIYEKMLSDPEILKRYFCKFNLELLNSIYEDSYLTGLATMSHCSQADKVLNSMGVRHKFKFVITREEVTNGKPNLEIYLKMKDKLNVEPEECIVVEDSVAGIKAALNAGMNVFAITNSITKNYVHQSGVISSRFIIDDPQNLKTTIYKFIEEQKNE